MLVQIWLLPVGMGRHGDGGDRALWTRIHQEVWVKKFSANCYPGDLKNLFREESEKAIARKKKKVIITSHMNGLHKARVKTARKNRVYMSPGCVDKVLQIIYGVT